MITIILQYHRRFIASWWGSEAIQGTLCPLGSQTLEQRVVKHQVTKSRHSHLKHQPNKGSKRRRARNQQHKWFQRCNFVTMNISRFLASEVSPSTQKPSWRASEPPVQGQRRPTVFGFPTSSSTQSIEPLAYAYAWCSDVFQSVSWLMPKKSQSVQQHKSLPSHETGGKFSCLQGLRAIPQTLLQHILWLEPEVRNTCFLDVTITTYHYNLFWQGCRTLMLFYVTVVRILLSWEDPKLDPLHPSAHPNIVLSCGLSLPTGQLVSLWVILTKKSQRNSIDHNL